jgi:hypothetical protein
MNVYLVFGWFGDQEWVESIFATEEAAEREVERLYSVRPKTGESSLNKYAVEEWEVKP